MLRKCCESDNHFRSAAGRCETCCETCESQDYCSTSCEPLGALGIDRRQPYGVARECGTQRGSTNHLRRGKSIHAPVYFTLNFTQDSATRGYLAVYRKGHNVFV